MGAPRKLEGSESSSAAPSAAEAPPQPSSGEPLSEGESSAAVSSPAVPKAEPFMALKIRAITRAVARQLKVQLPESCVLMSEDEITAYGTYMIPLNLRDADNKQIEIKVDFYSKAGRYRKMST